MAKKALTPAQEARREAIVRKARAAAKAAGKDWKTLSPDERKSFRVNARKELK
jgi:acyl-CoA reductase-like NAD-dependent aldehyde dehydrogenase